MGFADSIADSRLLAGQLPMRTSVGEFTDEYGNLYLLVLNREFEKPLEGRIPLNGHYRIYEVSREDGKQRIICENTDAIPVALPQGDAILLRLQKAEEEAFTLEYSLN